MGGFYEGEELNPMNAPSLLLAIVQSEDADTATRALVQAGLRVTRISSMGGFLQTGNVTLLLGLDRSQVAQAIELLAANCQTHTAFISVAPQMIEVHHAGYVMPLEVEVGGATIFVLPVERVVRFGARKEIAASASEKGRVAGMKLVMAIVPQERSGEILDVLMAGQYRATLISTTGGFLRRGNATLLIGVESEKTDDVLRRIEDVCTAAALRESAAVAWATVFVLDVEQYKHV